MTGPVIETRALTLAYPGRGAGTKAALAGLDLCLARGAVHALIGANGAGKSTLFRILLGFQAPTSGSARILDCDSGALTPALRARIGFVNEEHTLPGWLSVAAVVRMQQALYPHWSAARYTEVIRHFNVLPSQKIAQLSRGERAGVNLAMALAQHPELLILDEPTLGLDVVAKRVFLDTLMTAGFDDGATIVYCSHQMEEIERVADNLVILEHGRLRLMAAPADFAARVQLWIAEFPFREPEALATLPGILQRQHIDGLTHLIVFDQGPDFGARLKLLGARSADHMPVSLDRAVNGMLTSGHAGTARAA